MKQKIKSWFNLVKRKKYTAIVVLVVLLIIIFSMKGGNGLEGVLKSEKKVFEKVVAVSGKVVSVNEAKLSFESSGTVARVYKSVGENVRKGEIIALLNASDLYADKESAEADLLIERAELLKLKEGVSGSEVETKKIEAVNAIKDAYEKADDAIRNRVDQFYENGRSIAPKIKYTFEDYFSQRDKLNDGREAIEDVLVDWKMEVDNLTLENYSSSSIDNAISNISEVKNFLNELSFAVNSFEESNILTKTMIDGFRSDVSTGRTNISNSLSSLTSAKDTIRESVSNIPIQEARVKSAESKVSKIDAEISKTIIRAPFDGVISMQDAKLGESVPANKEVVGLISSSYEIEVLVPEISLPGIMLKNRADVTLDAYGDEKFSAFVNHIDPSETEKDGVSNYKVKLSFESLDTRIKSGMTANVFIVISFREGVLSIPERSVLKEDGKSFIYVEKGKEFVKTEIKLGERNGKGDVEVLNGLEEGQDFKEDPTII